MTAPGLFSELIRLGREAGRSLHAEDGTSQVKAAASLLKTAASAPAAVSKNPLASVQVIVREMAELNKVVEVERTKRLEIESSRQLALAQLEASRLLLEQYMARTFDDRKSSLERLFTSLDEAQARDDSAGMNRLLSSIVDIVKASPFKDLAQFKQSFDDPDFVLEL